MSKARDLANAGTALTTVSATELGYLDGVTSAVQTQLDAKAIPANVVNNTLADAKGDLITATADNTPARLAVGNNGETIVADSSTSTGLRYQVPKTQNAIYNSGFDIWQRGTTFTGINPFYGADRWCFARAGGATGGTWTRQSAGLTGFNYSVRAQRNSGNTGTQDFRVAAQSLETADSLRFAGKTVTFSFYLKVGANYSGGSNIYANVISGTGTDQQHWINGFTGEAIVVSNFLTGVTTSWQRFSVTGTVASNATEIAFSVGYTPSGTAGTNDWAEVTGLQLEEGSVATPYSRMTGTIQGELAACQRYYWQSPITTIYAAFGSGFWVSAGAFQTVVKLPVQMRVIPTSIISNQLAAIGVIDRALTNVALVGNQSSVNNAYITGEASGTSGLPGYLGTNNSTAGYLGISAEL
jgi:hypothetical protein